MGGLPQRSPLETIQTAHLRASVRAPFLGFLIFIFSALATKEGYAQSPPRSPSRTASSTPTELHVESRPWWPTKGSADRKEYAGSAACAKCHAEKAASQISTSMARASMRASNSEPLKSHHELSFNQSPYKYWLVTKNGQSVLSVTNGAAKTFKDLEWALGDGIFGQSYVYREKGKYYESQLSFYTALDGLDITTGHSRALPQNLEMAAGGYTPPASIRQCFGCHFTASTTSDRFDPDQAIVGVTCEACHGPGAEHVALMTSGALDAKSVIMNPATLTPPDSVDFCGACHRTHADAILQGLSGMGNINVRLQPYRLEKSKCWRSGDARLTCVACHDPHVQVTRDPNFYDHQCLQCHKQSSNAKSAADRPGNACKVGVKDCVTCHMPKIEVPGTHASFTDHWIRISHQGESYPE
jgi:hypothetical protein